MPPFHWWRTVCVLIPAVSAYTIVLGTMSIASSLVDRRGHFAHRCARWWARSILITTGVHVRVVGADRVRDDTSYVFAANHQSIYDIPIVFASLPHQLRIVAKASLGRFPFLGWHLRRSGHMLVDRERPGAGVLKRMSRLVRHGASLIVFPEGSRSVDGRVGPFKGGMFLLAIEAQLPVVPVTIQDSRHVMKKGRLMVCPGKVTLTLHEPIATVCLTREDARALAERVREVVASDPWRGQGSGVSGQEGSRSRQGHP
jgi:1-acyl-sn-glycerol-3-phosphate acyltransferase